MGYITAYLTFNTSIVFIVMSWTLFFNRQYFASKMSCAVGIIILIVYFLVQQVLFVTRRVALRVAKKAMKGFERGKYTPKEALKSLKKLIKAQNKVNIFCLSTQDSEGTFEFIVQSIQILEKYKCKS